MSRLPGRVRRQIRQQRGRQEPRLASNETIKTPQPKKHHISGEVLVSLAPQDRRRLRRKRWQTARQQRKLMRPVLAQIRAEQRAAAK